MSRPQACASCEDRTTCGYRCEGVGCTRSLCSKCAHSHGTCSTCDAKESEPGSLFDDRDEIDQN